MSLNFVENGILASRIEILTRYQDECIKKFGKSLYQHLYQVIQNERQSIPSLIIIAVYLPNICI